MTDDDRDSIMKMLLSSPSSKGESPSKMYRRFDDGRPYKLYTYLMQLNGQEEEVNPVALDHNYSLPVNNRVENSLARQAKCLFLPKTNNNYYHGSDVGVDTTQMSNKLKPAYDEEKSKVCMSEVERNLKLLRIERDDPDWDTNLDKSDWTTHQTRIFDRAVKILNMDRLARLTYQGSWNEPLLRKIAINKSARRFRNLFNSVLWQTRLAQWLNSTLLDNLDFPFLVSYIEILQALKKKVPPLLERITQNITCTKFSQDSLNLLLKKPWDPATLLSPHLNPRRLPGNPVMLVIPPHPTPGEIANAKMQRWTQHLNLVGHAVVVPTNNVQGSKATMVNCLDLMMASLRGKLNEMKSEHPGKHMILVGINSGAALACQAALCETVTAVVCLGFPMNTLDEHRGQPDDNILNLNTPVLFVVGQYASTAQVDDVEDLRERLMIDNSMVIVGEADDQLRIPKSKQMSEGITQTFVDRCIVEEVADFVSSVLSPPFTSQVDKQNRLRAVERKRRFPDSQDYQRKQVALLNTPPPMNSQQSGGPANNSHSAYQNPPRRGRVMTRGGSRIKYIQQSADSLAAMSRRTGLSKEVIIAATTQPLGPYNGNEERTANFSADTTSLVDQLTPDRLLEMPVIFAQEESATEPTVQQPTPRNTQVRQYKTRRAGPTPVQPNYSRQTSTSAYQTSTQTTPYGGQSGVDTADATTLTFDDGTVYFTDQNQPGSPFDGSGSVDLDVDLNII